MTALRPWDVPSDAITEQEPGSFLERCVERPDALVYLLCNVGDGDTQLLLLPEREKGAGRAAVVVDIATRDKLTKVVEQLDREGILAPVRAGAPTFPLVIGTHPHTDHIGGMPQFLEAYSDRIGEYWEPGYYHPSASFVETMAVLEDCPAIAHTQPTSGTTKFIDRVKLTALTPGVGLRNRFDSYGTDINNASISLKVEFPAARVSRQRDEREPQHQNRSYLRISQPWSIILGADTQTTGWAQAEVDFPELHGDSSSALARELRAATGRDHLVGHIFKLPHHASKRGVNLELLERVKPWIVLVSSVGGGGRYEFPHHLSLDATREALQPTGSGRTERLPDHRLGIHYTASQVRRGKRTREPLGSIAVMVLPERNKGLEMWRFADEPRQPIDLSHALKMAYVRKTSQEEEVDLTTGATAKPRADSGGAARATTP